MSSSRLVAGFADRLVLSGDSALLLLAQASAQLVGGTTVVLQREPSGLLRAVGQATSVASDAGLLDAMMGAAAVPADQAGRLDGHLGPIAPQRLPDLLLGWCRHRRPLGSTVLPLAAGGRDLGVVWTDVRTNHVTVDDLRALVAVAVARHVAVLEGGAAAEWAMRAETEMSARTEELETAHQSIDRLGSVVGHELRDTLRGLLGWARLASAPDLAEEVRHEMLRKIVHATERSSALVGDLLEDVEEQQADRLAHVAVDLNGVVGWVRDVLAERIEGQRARVVAAPLPTVMCNPTAVRRTLLELVRNSLEHGGRFVEVEIHAVTRHAMVELVVEDNGPGIVEDAREQVFQPGIGTGVGAGFGLTNAREALSRMGGRMWIEESGVGGVAVRVALPRPDMVAEDVPADF